MSNPQMGTLACHIHRHIISQYQKRFSLVKLEDSNKEFILPLFNPDGGVVTRALSPAWGWLVKIRIYSDHLQVQLKRTSVTWLLKVNLVLPPLLLVSHIVSHLNISTPPPQTHLSASCSLWPVCESHLSVQRRSKLTQPEILPTMHALSAAALYDGLSAISVHSNEWRTWYSKIICLPCPTLLVLQLTNLIRDVSPTVASHKELHHKNIIIIFTYTGIPEGHKIL